MAHLQQGSRSRRAQAVPRPPDVHSGRARSGTVARSCRVIFPHRVIDRSRMTLSKKVLLDTIPDLAAIAAISLRRAETAGPARPNVSWLVSY